MFPGFKNSCPGFCHLIGIVSFEFISYARTVYGLGSLILSLLSRRALNLAYI